MKDVEVKGSDEYQSFITFLLNDKIFAICSEHVLCLQEISKSLMINDTSGHTAKAMNYIGKIIPVIDIKSKLGLGQDLYDSNNCQILIGVKTPCIKTGAGIVADALCRVMEINKCIIKPPDKKVFKCNIEFLNGGVHTEKGWMGILDIAKILSAKDIKTKNRMKRTMKEPEPVNG